MVTARYGDVSVAVNLGDVPRTVAHGGIWVEAGSASFYGVGIEDGGGAPVDTVALAQ